MTSPGGRGGGVIGMYIGSHTCVSPAAVCVEAETSVGAGRVFCSPVIDNMAMAEVPRRRVPPTNAISRPPAAANRPPSIATLTGDVRLPKGGIATNLRGGMLRPNW